MAEYDVFEGLNEFSPWHQRHHNLLRGIGLSLVGFSFALFDAVGAGNDNTISIFLFCGALLALWWAHNGRAMEEIDANLKTLRQVVLLLDGFEEVKRLLEELGSKGDGSAPPTDLKATSRPEDVGA